MKSLVGNQVAILVLAVLSSFYAGLSSSPQNNQMAKAETTISCEYRLLSNDLQFGFSCAGLKVRAPRSVKQR
jgi:hypothetical protein